MLDRANVQAWLDRYVQAWRTYDRALIEALFTADATMLYHPGDEPVIGRDAIVESWLEEPDAPNSWQASYYPIAVDGNTAVTEGRTQYFTSDGSLEREFANIFVIEFDDSGRASSFREYYVELHGD